MLELRPFQAEALAALESPGHVLCVAPTGSGKSLIYERAARTEGRRTLLISPLVALARQQRQKLGPSLESRVRIISPERLQTPGMRRELSGFRPDFLVLDECHCLWEWGASFRPAFRAVPPLLRELGLQRSLWLTATLPPDARAELRLSVRPARLTELGGFALPGSLDLRAVRVPWAERAGALLGWIAQQSGPGIVFAPTRDAVTRLGRLISARGLRAVTYHAGLSSEERRGIEARLARELPDAIVATSAFGLGMDYPDLQWVALWQAPASLLALAQAIGRAGRAPSRTAHALVLWDEEDFHLLHWCVQGDARRARMLDEVRAFLTAGRCRKAALKAYFDEAGEPPETGVSAGAADCGACDFCGAARTGTKER